MFLLLNLFWYSKWHLFLHSSHSAPTCSLAGHILIKTCSEKTYSLWWKSKRIDCFIPIRRGRFLFSDRWQLSTPLHLPTGQGWHRQLPSLVGWAISCDRQLQALSHSVMALAWSKWARLDMSQLQEDAKTHGLMARTFESDRHILKAPEWDGTWRDLRAEPSSLQRERLGSELCVASPPHSATTGEPQMN